MKIGHLEICLIKHPRAVLKFKFIFEQHNLEVIGTTIPNLKFKHIVVLDM